MTGIYYDIFLWNFIFFIYKLTILHVLRNGTQRRAVASYQIDKIGIEIYPISPIEIQSAILTATVVGSIPTRGPVIYFFSPVQDSATMNFAPLNAMSRNIWRKVGNIDS